MDHLVNKEKKKNTSFLLDLRGKLVKSSESIVDHEPVSSNSSLIKPKDIKGKGHN